MKFDFNVSVSYDCDLAEIYFNDFKNGNMNDNVNLFFGSRKTDYLVIFENETVANQSYYKKSQLARMKKVELYELLENNNHPMVYACNIEDLKKSDMIDCLLEIDNQEYYAKHFENESYQDLEYDFSISGYSQGDYIKVKLVGNVEKWINKNYLTNLFFDTPISGYIEVFEDDNLDLVDEFQLYDLANFNEYDYYDKAKLIGMISDYCKNKNYHAELIEYLNDVLTNDLQYSY